MLLPLHAQHSGRMWGGHRAFLKHFGVNVSLWSKSHQQLLACTPSIFPGHWQTTWCLSKNAQASPCRCLGIPQSCVLLWDPPHLPLQEHQGRASGGRGAAARTRSATAREKNRLRKRGQINQADSFSSRAAGRKGLLCGERGGRASRPPAPGPRRRLWRQRQQLGRPCAPAPAKGASVALNAPFHHSSQGCRQEKG